MKGGDHMSKNILFLIVLMLTLSLFAGALADGAWYCPQCGRLNSENFCPADGTRRPADSDESYLIITTAHVNIRSGPASTYSLVGDAPADSLLTAVGRVASHEGGQDWYAIDYNGRIAYVSVMYSAVYSPSGSGNSYQPGNGAYTITDYRTDGNYSNYSHVRCTLNAKLATRTGPGTDYDEPGTFLSPGATVTVLSKAYDRANGIWWVQVEFSEYGYTYWAYTGAQRMNNLNLDSVPEEKVIGHCTTNSATTGSLCPRDAVKTMGKSIPAGVSCDIYGYVYEESGDYILIQFFDPYQGCYRRAWVKDWSVDNYTMLYGF